MKNRRQVGLIWLVIGIVLLGAVSAWAATHYVSPGESIQDAIDAATAGDTIHLAAGTHDTATTIDVNKSLTIEGSGAVTVQGTTIAARTVFEITASDVTLQNLDITLTSTYPVAPKELQDSLIGIPASAGLSGIVISGNTLHWPTQAGAMSSWGGRAITVGSSGSTDITITGNTVYDIRNGIVLHYGNVGVVSNNLVYNTKGGIMQYTSNLADAANRSMSGNTWGTVHNEWDIVWNSASYDPDYQASVIDLSNANPSAYVLDRRDAAGSHAVGNRSHIFVDPVGSTSAHEAKGNMNEPFATLGLAIEGVAADGTIYVAAGSYEGIAIDKQVLIDGTDIGGTIISSGIGYKPGSSLTTAFRLDAGADGTAIDDMTILCLPGIGYFFAVFSRGVDDVLLDNITLYDTVQGLTNWGGSGWSILDSQVIGTVASGGGGIGIFVGATMGYETASNNLIQGNVIGSDASAPDYSCPGIVLALDLRWGRFDEFATYDLGGNQIIGNTITDSGVLNGVGIEVGVIAETGNDPADVPGILAATLGAIHDTTISENTVAGEYIGLYLYNVVGTDVYQNVIAGNTSAGIGMWDGNIDNVFRYNSITGNAYGLYNGTGTLVDAALNWWGDNDGPSGEGTGAGDSVSTNVIYSPWLGADPDGNPAPGVQITGPMLIIVDDVGPEPALGYLNAAIDGANSADLPFIDTIEVRHGTYDSSEPITEGVTILSEVGSTTNTFLNGAMVIDAVNVLIGQMGQGFTINGPITVGVGVNASTIHINWNDIYDVVTNAGTHVLDATFNYWDTDGPDTVGRVRIYPYLPIPAADIIGYMDDYGFSVMETITFARLLLEGRPVGWAEVAIELADLYGISPDDAMALIREYGLGAVKRALRMASDLEDFLVMLMGYAVGGGGGGSFLGGGAGGGTGIPSFCVGCLVPLQLELIHPITGEPITDAVVSYSVCRTLPDGTSEIVMLGVMTYDGDLGAFTFDLDTSGLEPGIYDVYLGTDDGRSRHFQIEIVA